jgi:hypothetical protein
LEKFSFKFVVIVIAETILTTTVTNVMAININSGMFFARTTTTRRNKSLRKK